MSSSLFGQEHTINVTNYLTESYRDYPFTKISLNIPNEFVFSPIDNGFRAEKTSSVIRIETVTAPASEVIHSFLDRFDSATAVDSFGFTLIDKMNILLNKTYPGSLVELTAEVDGDEYRHIWLFVGDDSKTYVIKGMTPEENGETELRMLRGVMLSTFYDPTRIILAPGQDPTTTSSSACKCNDKK